MFVRGMYMECGQTCCISNYFIYWIQSRVDIDFSFVSSSVCVLFFLLLWLHPFYSYSLAHSTRDIVCVCQHTYSDWLIRVLYNSYFSPFLPLIRPFSLPHTFPFDFCLSVCERLSVYACSFPCGISLWMKIPPYILLQHGTKKVKSMNCTSMLLYRNAMPY